MTRAASLTILAAMAVLGDRSPTNLVSAESAAAPPSHEDEPHATATQPPGDVKQATLPARRATGTGRFSSLRDTASSHDRLRAATPERAELGEAEHLRESLLAARRYGATLNGLLSAVDVFARGVDGARTANDCLQRRIEHIKEQLDQRDAHRRDLEREISELKSRLETQAAEFSAERQFLTEGQDEFLRALLEEYEEEVQAARRESEAAALSGDDTPPESPESSRDELRELRNTVERLQAERERARELVRRMRSQRDVAQAELRRISSAPSPAVDPVTLVPATSPTTPAPPPFASSQTPAPAVEDPEPSVLQNLGVVRLPRLSPPPAELTASLNARPDAAQTTRPFSSPSSPSLRAAGASHSSGSMLAVKKPSGSYSATDVSPEETDGATTTRPPVSSSRPGIGASYRAKPPGTTESPDANASEEE